MQFTAWLRHFIFKPWSLCETTVFPCCTDVISNGRLKLISNKCCMLVKTLYFQSELALISWNYSCLLITLVTLFPYKTQVVWIIVSWPFKKYIYKLQIVVVFQYNQGSKWFLVQNLKKGGVFILAILKMHIVISRKYI